MWLGSDYKRVYTDMKSCIGGITFFLANNKIADNQTHFFDKLHPHFINL